MVTAVDSSGLDYTLQPSMWRQKISRWNACGGSNAVPGIDGMATPTSIGTNTARNVATTNALARAKRLGCVSASSAGSLAARYVAQAQVTLGTGTNVGGFFYSCRFGVSDATLQSVARTFIGMSSSLAAPTNVSPAKLTNSIGIGHDAGATTWSLYYGGSTAQTPISLGANSPINLADLIDVTLWSPPNQDGVVHYYVERKTLTGSFYASGVLGTSIAGVTLPANTTLLAPRAWRCNNTAAVAVGLDISSIYIETDW